MRTEIMFQHGWGFDHRAWSEWICALKQEPEIEVICGERGYFGETPNNPQFSVDAPNKIIIAHSLGLHLLDKETIKQATAVMLVGGFLSFHPKDVLSGKRSRRVIRMMQEKLGTEPKTVLRDFHAKCYAPECSDMLTTQSAELSDSGMFALRRDLQILDTSVIDVSELENAQVLILLQGKSDQIVHAESCNELLEQNSRARRIWIAAAGHCLPFTHAETCILILKETISRIRSTGKEPYVFATSSK